MSSETRCSSVMVVPYQWILENIEEDIGTLSSKMILFRGEEVFRVALKKVAGFQGQTLIFKAMNLNKLGIKVQQVFYSNQNLENSMESLEKQGDGGTLQVFSVALRQSVFGKTTFTFHIQIEGTEAEYSYHLADRLLKNQLWMTVKNLQWTDIELCTKYKKLSAHKCILAARSPVFAAEFDNNHMIKIITIHDVDYSTLEQFIYFLYTGETNKSLANEQLFKLADRYQLTTLASLCKKALDQIDAEQVMRSLIHLPIHPYNNPISSLETRPTKDTELYFDPNTSTFLAEWNFVWGYQEIMGPVFFQYQNEKLFSVHIKKSASGHDELRLICTRYHNSGYEIVEAFYVVKNNHVQRQVLQWKKMERRNVQEKGFIFIFLERPSNLHAGIPYTVSFRINIASSIDNYRYELMDAKSVTQIWSAASTYKLADVEISVGSRKYQVHRVVLSARSPVFDAQLKKDTNLHQKSFITISDEVVDPNVFRHFLEFLYTGT